MRRLPASLALVVGLALLAAGGGGAATSGTLDVTQSGGARFPDRSYILHLPEQRPLTTEDVTVRENGREVSSLSVVAANAAGKGQFGVVLVIDASNSMHGEAITGAVEAARAFVANRNPNQELAIVSFNRLPTVILPFTTDRASIDAALATEPRLALGTHVYDAVTLAVKLLRQAHIVSGSIVVLSDGADTGSEVDAATAARLASAAGVRVFTIGLASGAFTPETLSTLARDTGAAYSEASSPEALEDIFAGLSAQLASEYLLQYRSLAGPKEDVHVVVKVKGVRGVAKTRYETPPLPTGPAPVFHRPVGFTFWLSAFSVIVAVLAAALLIALAFALLVRPRRQTLRRRMAEFISMPLQDSRKKQGALLTDRVLVGADKSLGQARWWGRFKEDLELAEVKVPAAQIVLWTVVATVLAAWILTALLGSPLFGVLALAIPFFVRSILKRKLERKRKAFAEQLPDNLQVLASALRAGHSFVAALSVVVDDAPEPSRSEFGRVVSDEQLGASLEEALGVVVRRMANRDLEQVSLVAALQHETGGNTAEVLDRVTETVRERYELRRMVKTLTAQGRMSRWIVSFLPVALLVLITLLNPRYMEPLYTHTFGRVMLAFAAVMVVAGSLVIKRIVDIKV